MSKYNSVKSTILAGTKQITRICCEIEKSLPKYQPTCMCSKLQMNQGAKIEDKGPYNPYYYFIMTRHAQIRRQNVSLPVAALLQVIDERWEDMHGQEKAQFYKEYEQYKNNFAIKCLSLPTERRLK